MVKITVEVIEDGKEAERYDLEGAGAIMYAFKGTQNHGGAVGLVNAIDFANMLLDLHRQDPVCVTAALRAFDDYIDKMGENYANEVKEDEPNA